MAFKTPAIKKSEYGTQRFFKQRAKYYLFGVSIGTGLLADAFLRSRDPNEAFAGWVSLGGSMLGYATDYKHQISLREGFKAKKLFIFADGTKVFAVDKNSAIRTYRLHKYHTTHPHHFSLFHIGEKNIEAR
jgi:hypothetical protein